MSEKEKKEYPDYQEMVKMLRAVRGERQGDIPTPAAIRAACALAYVEVKTAPLRKGVEKISRLATGS